MPSLSDFPKLTSTISKAICHDYREFKRDNEGGPIKKPDATDNNTWIKKIKNAEEALKILNKLVVGELPGGWSELDFLLLDTSGFMYGNHAKRLLDVDFKNTYTHYFKINSRIKIFKDESTDFKALEIKNLKLPSGPYRTYLNLCLEHTEVITDEKYTSQSYRLVEYSASPSRTMTIGWNHYWVKRDLFGYIPIYRQKYTNIQSTGSFYLYQDTDSFKFGAGHPDIHYTDKRIERDYEFKIIRGSLTLSPLMEPEW